MKRNDSIDFKEDCIKWSKHTSNDRYWLAKFDDKTFYLRMNNFPDEPLYTFISKKQIEDLDDLPENWFLED